METEQGRLFRRKGSIQNGEEEKGYRSAAPQSKSAAEKNSVARVQRMEDAGTGKERHTKREVHAGKGGERMK